MVTKVLPHLPWPWVAMVGYANSPFGGCILSQILFHRGPLLPLKAEELKAEAFQSHQKMKEKILSVSINTRASEIVIWGHKSFYNGRKTNTCLQSQAYRQHTHTLKFQFELFLETLKAGSPSGGNLLDSPPSPDKGLNAARTNPKNNTGSFCLLPLKKSSLEEGSGEEVGYRGERTNLVYSHPCFV